MFRRDSAIFREYMVRLNLPMHFLSPMPRPHNLWFWHR